MGHYPGQPFPKNLLLLKLKRIMTYHSDQLRLFELHKYAIQITVADQRDGALSGSTLKEASSWGKVETTFEQMVYSEATIGLPRSEEHTSELQSLRHLVC